MKSPRQQDPIYLSVLLWEKIIVHKLPDLNAELDIHVRFLHLNNQTICRNVK